MARYRLTLEWDGRPYMGWQRQAHGPSVQQVLEEAAQSIVGEAVTAHAAGRTDAGVHARAMVAHFDTARELSPYRMAEALNARLRPHPVAVLSCDIVDDAWHARFSCIGRAYEYRICNRRAPLTFAKGLAWQVAVPLDAAAMTDAAQCLIGSHDFTTFRSVHCQAQSPMKTLDRLAVERCGEEIIVHAAARSFLHHQVRSMVGCLVLVGRGRWTKDDLAHALAARSRDALGHNAPPDGLYFTAANYPEN
ncbi:MAG: tRNA pseudouridine(38-40) synthase TruA [Sphingomonadaceae bacterium]|nr:tRNA pseudouridine(38-40) synthase TruA [Sphingomonadaceae bacterium]